MYILRIGVVLIIQASIAVTNSKPCGDDGNWLEYDGKCLNYYSKAVPWTSAYKTCVDLRGSQLATVNSPEINKFVQNNLTEGSDVWIGLSIPDISKPSWKWSDWGNTSSYDDWNDAGVTSACAVMKYDNSVGYWYTKQCTKKKNFVCEKEMWGGNCSDSNWLSFDTHCYLIITEPKDTNMAAARNCWQHDAYLISINNQQEADFIYSNIVINTAYWIGLSPLKWVNGLPYNWNNWGKGGPSTTERCVYMKATSGKWYSGGCENTMQGFHPYLCQKDAEYDIRATIINSQKSEEADTSTKTVLSEVYTTEFNTLNMFKTKSSTISGLSKQFLLTAVVPAVCGGLVAVIVIIVVVIVLLRKRRSNGYNKRNPPRKNTTYVTNDMAVEGDKKDIAEHKDQEYCIYDEAEVVQADNGTVVVNGDVYAIVDKDKIQNQKGLDNMVSQQQNNTKQEIAQGHNHIIVGSDVYAIVDKNNVNQNKQQKPKQKKKKQQTPPKLEDKSAEIKSNGLSHIVVGTDVYAVVDKEKVTPNKQQTSQQKKKKPPAPPKLENKTVAINEGNVYYNEFDMQTVPVTPTKRKPKVEKKTEDTGVVYADLDLTGSGSGDRPNRNNDEESGVVYADVRG